MKRLFTCMPLIVVATILVANSFIIITGILNRSQVPIGIFVGELILLVLVYLLYDLTAGSLSGGERVPAMVMLTKGSIIRLIAVSLPDDDSDYIGILAEIKTGKVRYLVIHNPKKTLILTPGHYYRYKKWGQLELAPFGKL